MPIRTALPGLFLVGLLTATSSGQDVTEGERLYQKHCSHCHGANLRGGNAQSLLDGVWQFGEGRGYMFRNIKHGITHLGMPAYEASLSDDQIRSIVHFILAVERTEGVTKPGPPERLQSQEYEIAVEQWVKDLEIPWAIAFADSDTALVTERPGGLRVVEGGVLKKKPVEGTPPVLHEGQGGLLDVAVDPDYGENGWVYLAYSHALDAVAGEERPRAMTRLVRGRIDGSKWEDEQVIYEAPTTPISQRVTTTVHASFSMTKAISTSALVTGAIRTKRRIWACRTARYTASGPTGLSPRIIRS